MITEYILENKINIFKYLAFGTPLEDLELKTNVDSLLSIIIYKEYAGKDAIKNFSLLEQHLNSIQKLDLKYIREDLINFWRQQGSAFTGLEIQRLENKINNILKNDVELDISVVKDNILSGSRLKALIYADELMRNKAFLKSLIDNIQTVFYEKNPDINNIIYKVKDSNLIEFYFKGQLFYTKLPEL